ncbi:MAG: hypothetical protein EPN51_25960, partial [Mycobacterium sp.]
MADADAPEGEEGETETTEQASSTQDQATTAGDVEGDETSDEGADAAADEDAGSDGPGGAGDDEVAGPTKRRISMSPVRLAMVVGVVAVL